MDELEKLREELAEANARRADLRAALEWSNAERDEHKAKREEYAAEARSLRERLKDAYRERDEARAALADATTEWKARRCECGADDFCKIVQERDEARAEVDRLKLSARLWADDIDAVSNAYRRGAEAMRDECIGAACGFYMGTTGFCNGDEDELEAVLEALPIPEEP